AVQESLGRHVALKVLPFHSLMGPSHLERFRREAQAAARLHHSNIVPVFGIGEHEGIHYYAMQFIQGQSLDDVIEEVKRLRGEKIPATESGDKRIAGSVAQALVTGRFQAWRLADNAAGAGGEDPPPSPGQQLPAEPGFTQGPGLEPRKNGQRLAEVNHRPTPACEDSPARGTPSSPAQFAGRGSELTSRS